MLKGFRRILARYDKLDVAFVSCINFAPVVDAAVSTNRWERYVRGGVAAVLWLAAGLATAAEPQGREELFASAEAPMPAASRPVDALPAIRSRPVRLDMARLAALTTERAAPAATPGASAAGSVILNLFDDVRFEAVFERRLPLKSGYALRGRLVGKQGGRWTLAVRDATVTGTVLTDRKAYVLQIGLGGRQIVSEVDRSLFPPDDPQEQWRVRLPPDPIGEVPESLPESRQPEPAPPRPGLVPPERPEPRPGNAGGRWLPIGPASILNGQVENVSPDDEVAGAIHTVLAHPANADTLYVGAVNGGVWRTDNATDERPDWKPLTDRFPSLSIGAMAMDPNDPNVILVGIGRYSSYYQSGGDRIGLLLTKNGGDTWTRIELPFGTPDTRNISGVAIDGDRLVASAGPWCCTSVYRSLDGGDTWDEGKGLPPVGTFDLVVDPTNRDRLYATMKEQGVFRSDDGGGSWQDVSSHDETVRNAFTVPLCPDGGTDCPDEKKGTNNNAEMAVAGNGRLYLAVLIAGQAKYIGFSDDQGDTWKKMDLPLTGEANDKVDGLNPRFKPGSQGAIHFSIRVDPDQPNIVYVGGDRQNFHKIEDEDGNVSYVNSLGARDYSGRLFRGDAAVEPTGKVPSPQWQHLTHRNDVSAIPDGGTANGSAPHADSREMAFDAGGDLIEVNDGGVYRRTAPRDNTGDWFSLNGNLQISEMHNIAYDPLANIVLGGNQDTGTPQQTATDSKIWNSVGTADGGDVAVDASNAPDYSIRYSSFQLLRGFRRFFYDADNESTSEEYPRLAIKDVSVYELNPGFGFTQAVILNAVDPSRGVLPASSIYETTDRFDTLTEIHSLDRRNSEKAVTAAYGCSTNPNLLYVGTNAYEVLVRAGAADSFETTSYSGESPRDILIDPRDCATVYVADVNDVYVSNDTGTTWRRITGNLEDVPVSLRDLHSLEFVPADGPFGAAAILLAGRGGVHAMFTDEEGVWLAVNERLPGAPAWDLDYEPTDNVLVVSTLGRGAWRFQGGLVVLEPIADIALEVTGGSTTVSLEGVFDDPIGTELSYTATSSDETIATVSVDGAVVTVTPHAAGVATIQVGARDAQGVSGFTTFVVTVGAVLNIAATTSAAEGETVRVSVTLSRALAESIDVDYRLAPDADAVSVDADEEDYVAPAGTFTIAAGSTSGAIEVAINDDDQIEPTREAFAVHLTAPARNPDFGIGLVSTSIVVINEGVCDRTTQLREAIAQALGVSTCDAVAALDRLARLDLSGRKIERFKRDDFLDLTGLRHLDLSNNELADVPIFNPSGQRPGPWRLEMLLLDSNRLTTLPRSAFNAFYFLRGLKLRNNRLATLASDTFDANPLLEELLLSDNALERLPADIFKGLAALEGLHLQGNPGAPFMFPLELARTDAVAWQASSPATVAARIDKGAPFELAVALQVAGGSLSATTTTLAAGAVSSNPVFVAQIKDAAAQVTVLAPSLPTADCGTPPTPCYQGFKIVAGEPLLLFKARPTVIVTPPAQTLETGGEAVEFDLKRWISDPDSDSLVFTVESDNPSLATVEIKGDLLVVVPGNDEGTAVVTITATDSDGYSVALFVTVIVDLPMHGLLRGWRLPVLIEHSEER